MPLHELGARWMPINTWEYAELLLIVHQLSIVFVFTARTCVARKNSESHPSAPSFLPQAIMTTRSTAPHTRDDENASAQQNHAPQPRKYNTRAASRRALADIGNRQGLRDRAPNAEKPSIVVRNSSANIAERGARGSASVHRKVEPVVPPPTTAISLEDDDVEFVELPALHDAVAVAQASLAVPPGVLDIDSSSESNDVTGVVGSHLWERGLALAIHQSQLAKEIDLSPPPNYLDNHVDVTGRMRSILIDWLVDVVAQFRLCDATLHLAVNLVDRYLANVDGYVRRAMLQLVGIGALYVASKYEEIYSPAVDDFVYIADGTYTRAQVLRMEAVLCNTLRWRIGAPTMLPFLARCIKAARSLCSSLSSVVHFASYCSELALTDYVMLKWRPSQIAAASMALGTRLLPGCLLQWDATLVYHSGGYSEHVLIDCAQDLAKLLLRENDSSGRNKLTAVQRKYAVDALSNISLEVKGLDVDEAVRKMRTA